MSIRAYRVKKIETEINTDEIKRKVARALDIQFEIYSWEDMLKDALADTKEIDWAMKHLTYTVKEI